MSLVYNYSLELAFSFFVQYALMFMLFPRCCYCIEQCFGFCTEHWLAAALCAGSAWWCRSGGEGGTSWPAGRARTSWCHRRERASGVKGQKPWILPLVLYLYFDNILYMSTCAAHTVYTTVCTLDPWALTCAGWDRFGGRQRTGGG